ncbi:pyridoxamine 5'-phosphate oxidase family protein [Tateyamaria sp.]|uniref:pyridoxamine 5'-phosphate oxidase family protein n=1 Tax=Tateyamaria sp. TaxID=1929288 RepID=UPI00329EB56F
MDEDKRSMFHEGHRELQDKFDGRALADALEKRFRYDALEPDEIALIEMSEFFFLATAHGKSVDCSYKGGPRGFVRVTGPTTLEWPDYDGNSMYRSLGNLARSPRAGLLFIRFGEAPARLRVNGECELVETSGVKSTIRLHADEIFPNCPRYIPDLASGTQSPNTTEDGDIGPKPRWKDMPGLAENLPGNDPHR